MDNEKDLEDIPDNVKKGIKIIPVSTVDEVLKHALTEPLRPIEWHEEDELKSPHPLVQEEDEDPTHPRKLN